MLWPNLTEVYVGTLKVWYIYNIFYLLTLFYVKFSILAFYRRLSPAPEYQLALQVTGGFVAAFTVVMILVTVSWIPAPHQPANELTGRKTGSGMPKRPPPQLVPEVP